MLATLYSTIYLPIYERGAGGYWENVSCGRLPNSVHFLCSTAAEVCAAEASLILDTAAACFSVPAVLLEDTLAEVDAVRPAHALPVGRCLTSPTAARQGLGFPSCTWKVTNKIKNDRK